MRRITTALILLLAIPTISSAQVGPGSPSWICNNIVPINAITNGGVLYKTENIHGGRGPSFLVQNVAERTNKQVIEVRNAKCELIGTFGLFRTDQPDGSRYYSKSGGSGFEADDIHNVARQAGSDNILIEGVGKWIRVKNPTAREGSVRKIEQALRGNCDC